MSNLDDRESDIKVPETYEFVKMRPIPPKIPHWFFERADGTVIDVSEQEAALIEKDSNRSRKLKRWGYSSGEACIEYLRNCGFRPGQEVPYTKAQEIQKAAYDAELTVAKGKWRRPIYQAGNFDGSIKNHPNADSIIRSFGI